MGPDIRASASLLDNFLSPMSKASALVGLDRELESTIAEVEDAEYETGSYVTRRFPVASPVRNRDSSGSSDNTGGSSKDQNKHPPAPHSTQTTYSDL